MKAVGVGMKWKRARVADTGKLGFLLTLDVGIRVVREDRDESWVSWLG